MNASPNIKLKTALLERNITQRDLAFRLEIDESRISRIIRGYEKPTSDIKEAISDYLKIKPEELFLI